MDFRERISQTDAVVEELKRYFLSDEVRVGDKLPTEKMLCQTYQVGRSTVREAIRTLQVMGFVEIRPGRGAFLAAKRLGNVDSKMAAWIIENRPNLVDIVRIRIALEGLALQFAIEKASVEELEAIDRTRLVFEQALKNHDFGALAALDEEFHQSIVAASHCELLATLSNVSAMAFRDWRDRSFKVRKHAANAIMPHQKIAAAILARDVELAQLQMRRHLEQILVDMAEGMKPEEQNELK